MIDFEMKKMLPLTKKELKSHKDAKQCYICGKLSKLVDNLTEGIHKIKCKYCSCFHEYENVKPTRT